MEIWLSALSHRHIAEVNERGIPYPCSRMDDLLSIIFQIEPTQTGVFLKLLKDHDSPVPPEAVISLDPNTYLAKV